MCEQHQHHIIAAQTRPYIYKCVDYKLGVLIRMSGSYLQSLVELHLRYSIARTGIEFSNDCWANLPDKSENGARSAASNRVFRFVGRNGHQTCQAQGESLVVLGGCRPSHFLVQLF